MTCNFSIISAGIWLAAESKKITNMKTVITTVIFAALIMLPFSASAQSGGDNLWGFTGPTDLDVRGVHIGGRYTRAQVQARWGVPTTYRSSVSDRGLNEVYDYGVGQNNSQFLFGENGFFHSFVIASRDFTVLTRFSGGIRVGDNISRVQAIGLGVPVRQSDGSFHLWLFGSDMMLGFEVSSSNIITLIWYSTPI